MAIIFRYCTFCIVTFVLLCVNQGVMPPPPPSFFKGFGRVDLCTSVSVRGSKLGQRENQGLGHEGPPPLAFLAGD